MSFLHSVRSVFKNTKRVIYVPLNGEILHLNETPASLATSQRVLSDQAVQSSRDRRLSCGCTTARLYARPDAASLVVTIYRSVVLLTHGVVGSTPTSLPVAPSFSPGSYCCFFYASGAARVCVRLAVRLCVKCGTCQSATGVQQRESQQTSLLLLLCSVCEWGVLLN